MLQKDVTHTFNFLEKMKIKTFHREKLNSFLNFPITASFSKGLGKFTDPDNKVIHVEFDNNAEIMNYFSQVKGINLNSSDIVFLSFNEYKIIDKK